MFAKIRNHLTLVYAGVMVCYLLAFIIASYSSLVWVLYREEQQDVEAYAREEAREHVNVLRQIQLTGKLPADDNDDQNDETLFHYAFDLTGQQISSSEPPSDVRDVILKNIRNWKGADGEAILTKVYLPDDKKNYFMICSIRIADGEQALGTVFVGKDITSYYEMLKRLLVVLIIASLLFLIIATFAGHMLAGRAMIPITSSFSRQREFVADASHELRTPLSVMLTSVDAIQSDDENRLSAFSGQVLDDMKSEIKRMTKIVADLLTLARADAGAGAIVKENFDLTVIADKVIRSFQPLANERGIRLEFSGVNSLTINADKERINQLLVILIDNALKYAPESGRVLLAVKAASAPKRPVSIIVQDNGAGIPAEQQQLIFERFYRIDKVRSREAGGTGLGLSIAKWIAEAHGGTIKVESTVGAGSTFTVSLPGSD